MRHRRFFVFTVLDLTFGAIVAAEEILMKNKQE